MTVLDLIQNLFPILIKLLIVYVVIKLITKAIVRIVDILYGSKNK